MRIRLAASRTTMPAAAVDPDWLIDHFHQIRDQFANSVRRASGLDLRRLLIVEAIYTLIQSRGGTLAFLAVHDRRHLWQAERIRSFSRFPRQSSWPHITRPGGQPSSRWKEVNVDKKRLCRALLGGRATNESARARRNPTSRSDGNRTNRLYSPLKACAMIGR